MSEAGSAAPEDGGDRIVEIASPKSPQADPFDPEPGRERIRAALAITLIGCVVFQAVAITVSLIWGGLTAADVTSVAAAVLSPTIALAGAATGFYYAAKR